VTVAVTAALVLRPLLEDRGRITESAVSIVVSVNKIVTEMFLDHDETSPSIAAVSALSVVCSMLAVQQQKRLCRQFVKVSVARRGCHTMRRVKDQPGILATDVRRSEMYSDVCPRSDL